MKSQQRGVTLVELVVAVALVAIVVSFGVSFIATPVQTLELAEQREKLASDASRASLAITRDLRAALPGSLRAIRSGSVLALELLLVSDTTAALPDALAISANQKLQLGTPDGSFETLGSLLQTTLPLNTRVLRLATHDPGSALSPYAANANITPAGTRVRISTGSSAGQNLIRLTPAATFGGLGVGRHLYLLAGAVTYLCDSSTGQLQRFSGYSTAVNQALRDSAAELLAAGAAVALVAENVQGCQFTTSSNVAARQTAATVALQFARSGATLAVSNTAVIDDAG